MSKVKKISVKTYEVLVDEIELARKKDRTISSISNSKVAEIIENTSKNALSSKETLTALLGTGVASGLVAGMTGIEVFTGVAGSGAAGLIGGTTAGAVGAGTAGLIGGTTAGAVGAGTAGFIGGEAIVVGATGAAAGLTAGAEAGATGGILGGPVGIVIGVAAGTVVGGLGGLLFGKVLKKKDEQRKQAADQKILSKQNTIIKELMKEIQVLSEKSQFKEKEIERLKYIVGVLTVNDSIMSNIKNPV